MSADKTASLDLDRKTVPAIRDISGTVIGGRYKVLSVLGEGGFGIVYEAEQQQPVRRRVALKVLKPGMDSKAVLARFEAERQALAMMDHPNIARVLDGGVAEEGRSYFVMELVRGEPITAFCDTQRLTIDQRLELLIHVCESIQHAHQKGIIHRDLKPSNILVEYSDGKAVPKVIDFGVAKALNQRLTQATIFTERGQLIGTPEYMSPEQAEMSGLDVDTRTDVYSLGVVLYQLLVGATPFDSTTLREAGFAEIQRIIREVEPPKASTRLRALLDSHDDPEAATRIVKARRADAWNLGRALKRDLDWVLLKCLEKDRERRYETANALAMELRRYLNDEPVLAGPPTTSYRLRKFIGRNRAAVATTAIVIAALVASTAISLTFAIRADRARDELLEEVVARTRAEETAKTAAERAENEAQNAEQQRAFMESEWEYSQSIAESLNKMFLVQGRIAEKPFEVTIGDIARHAEAEIIPSLGDQPRVQAGVIHVLANAFAGMGDYEHAENLYGRALDIRTRVLGPDHRDTAESMMLLGLTLWRDGGRAEGLTLLTQGYKTLENALHGDHPVLIRARASLARFAQPSLQSESDLRDAVASAEHIHGEESEEAVRAMEELARHLVSAQKIEDAERLFLTALEIARRRFGSNNKRTVDLQMWYFRMLVDLGRYADAEPLLGETLRASVQFYGPTSERVFSLLERMSTTYVGLDRSDDAVQLMVEHITTHHPSPRQFAEVVAKSSIPAVVRNDIVRCLQDWSPPDEP